MEIKEKIKPLFYRYKFWMRDVGVFSAEYSVAGRFINEAVNFSILLTVKGYDIGWLGIGGLYLSGLILMGLMGRMLRRAEIPHLTNTLQNEMNLEMIKLLEQQEEILKILKDVQTRDINSVAKNYPIYPRS